MLDVNYALCHYAECHYADCCGIMLSYRKKMFSKSNKGMATIQSQMQLQSSGKFGFKKSTKMSFMLCDFMLIVIYAVCCYANCHLC